MSTWAILERQRKANAGRRPLVRMVVHADTKQLAEGVAAILVNEGSAHAARVVRAELLEARRLSEPSVSALVTQIQTLANSASGVDDGNPVEVTTATDQDLVAASSPSGFCVRWDLQPDAGEGPFFECLRYGRLRSNGTVQWGDVQRSGTAATPGQAGGALPLP